MRIKLSLYSLLYRCFIFVDKMYYLKKDFDIAKEREAQGFIVTSSSSSPAPPLICPSISATVRGSPVSLGLGQPTSNIFAIVVED